LSVDDLTIVDVDWVNAMSQRLWRNVNGAWFLISGPIDAETIEATHKKPDHPAHASTTSS